MFIKMFFISFIIEKKRKIEQMFRKKGVKLNKFQKNGVGKTAKFLLYPCAYPPRDFSSCHTSGEYY